MNLRRIIRGFARGLVALTLLTGVSCRWSDEQASLPKLTRHPELPAAFNQELAERHQRAINRGEDFDAVRDLARLYHANGLYDEAKACYGVIAASPGGLTARDHYYLADLARQQNDDAQLRQELRAVIAAEPSYVPARIALADGLFKTGETEAAEEEYVAVLEIEPDQLQTQVALARIELQQDEEDVAVSRLEDVMAAHPESTQGAALLAQLLRRRGETDRAAALARLSQAQPEPAPVDPWMQELLADLYDARQLGLEAEYSLRRGHVAAAETYLRRIEAMDPSSPAPPIIRGQMAMLVRQYDAAVAHFREALTNGGSVETVGPSITQALLNLERPAEAEALMADYYRRTPDSIPIAKAYADALVANGNDQAARPVLEQVLQAEPNLRRPNMELARILWDAEEYDAAVPYLQRVATVYADDIPSRALLSEYYLDKEEPDPAIPLLQEALARATRETPVHQQLTVLLGSAYVKKGNKLAALGKLDEAVLSFEETARILPDDPTAYLALGNLFVHLEQYPQAGAVLERLVELQPENPTILLSLGDVEHRQGQNDAAKRRWQEALKFVAAGDTALREALQTRLRTLDAATDSP